MSKTTKQMENKLDEPPTKSEEITGAKLKSIKLLSESLIKKEAASNKIRSNELFPTGNNPIDELSGVCIGGVHYYDFKNVHFINNTGIASLIDLLKCLLEQGVKVKFVNVSENVKNKIKSMGLENILNCS